METIKHIVEVDERNMKLLIFRVLDNGVQEFLTETYLPDINSSDDWDVFASFAKNLGENILMDSPAARKHFRM